MGALSRGHAGTPPRSFFPVMSANGCLHVPIRHEGADQNSLGSFAMSAIFQVLGVNIACSLPCRVTARWRVNLCAQQDAFLPQFVFAFPPDRPLWPNGSLV